MAGFRVRRGRREAKQDSDAEKAKAAAALWELRLRVAGDDLAQSRETCGKLARANDELAARLRRQERDAVDLTAHLEARDAASEEKVSASHVQTPPR